MNITTRRLTIDSDTDSESTENSVDNGKTCIVRFRHHEFMFERRIYLSCDKPGSEFKRLASSPIKNENSSKKICLLADPNNNLFETTTTTRNLETEPNRIGGVVDLTSIFDEFLKNIPTDDLINLGWNIDFNCDQKLLDQIEIDTRHRLSDEKSEWKKLQIGRICGTVFKDVCHSYSKYPSKQLMNRICRINKAVDPSTNWLRRNYLTVRTKYERIMIKKHINFIYRKCGLVLRSDYPQFCVNPGGIVECECCGRGTIEFYCPYEIRKEKMIYSLTCLNETDDYEYELQKDSNFYYKMQLHMFLTDTNYCDFVIWTMQDYLDIRIKRDNDFLFYKVNVAKTFFVRKIVPEMFVSDYSGC